MNNASRSQSFIVIMRWVILALTLLLCGISMLWVSSYDRWGILMFFAVTIVVSVCHSKQIYIKPAHWAIIHAVDLMSISLLILGRNGIQSECFQLYYLVILQAGLVFGARQALICLFFSSVLYIMTVMFTGPTNDEIRKLAVRIIYYWLVGVTGGYLVYLERKHWKQAITDSVTSIYNRSYLEQSLKYEFKKAFDKKSQLSVIMIDIDNFKSVNDDYGHKIGDLVLLQVAKIIQSNIRDIDFVARYGGEEFMVALPEIGSDRSFEIAERIRRAVEEAVFYGIHESIPINVTISLGLACYPMQASNLDELMKKADEYLYAAKKAGRNQVCYKVG